MGLVRGVPIGGDAVLGGILDREVKGPDVAVAGLGGVCLGSSLHSLAEGGIHNTQCAVDAGIGIFGSDILQELNEWVL